MLKNKKFIALYFLMFSAFSFVAQTKDKSQLLSPNYSLQGYFQLRDRGVHKDALRYLNEMGKASLASKNVADFVVYLTQLPSAVEFARLEKNEKTALFHEIDSISFNSSTPFSQLAHLFVLEQNASNSYLWEIPQDPNSLEKHFTKIYQEAALTSSIPNPFFVIEKYDTLYKATHPLLIDHLTEKIIQLSYLQPNKSEFTQLLEFTTSNAFKSQNYYAYLEWNLQKNQQEKKISIQKLYEQLFEQIKFSPAALKLSLLMADEQLKLGANYHWKKAPTAVNANEQGYVNIANAIKAYPNSLYLAEAQQKIQSLEQTSFNAAVHGQLLTNSTNLLSVNYKNTDTLYLKIFHIQKRNNSNIYTNYYRTLKLSEIYTTAISTEKKGKFNFHSKDLLLPKWKNTGDYLLIMTSKENEFKEIITKDTLPEHIKFAVSEVSVHSFIVTQKNEQSTTQIRISDPTSGKPLKNCKIASGATILFTDKNGYCSFPSPSDYSPIKVSKGLDSVLVQHYYYDNYNPLIPEFNYKLLTDKGIYQPGQTIQAKGLVYKGIDPNFKTTDNLPLTIELKDQNGKTICSKTSTTNEFGSAAFELAIPESGFLQGQCQLYLNQYYVNSIQIAAYKKPNFEIKLTLNQSDFQYNDLLKIKGTTRRFSGIPLQWARVQLRLTEQAYFQRSNETLIDTVLTSNAQGLFDFALLLKNKTNDRWGKQVLIDCIVTSPEGETQTTSTSLFVGNQKEELLANIPSQVLTSDTTPFTINFKDSTKTAPKAIHYLVVRKKKQLHSAKFYKEESEFKSFTSKMIAEKMPNLVYYDNDKNSTYDTILNQQLPNSVTVQQLIQSEPGEYELHYTYFGATKDTLSGNCQFNAIQPNSSKNQHRAALWIYSLKKNPEVGEKVAFIVGCDGTKQWSTISIHRGTTKIKEWFVKMNKRKVIEYTIDKEDIGGLTLSAISVQHGVVSTVSFPLTISRKTKTLSLQLTTLRNQLTPGTSEKWELKCAPLVGEKSNLELAATLIDSKVEQIAPTNWNLGIYQDNSTPSTWYGSSFDHLHYFNALNLDYFNNYELNEDGPMRKRMPVMLMNARGATMDINTLQSSSEKIEIRKNFAETAFFYPQLKSDSTGKFSFKFQVPDALTTWRFKAFAHDQNMRAGAYSQEFVAQKLLMVQANTPRFFRQGDTINFSATLDNLTNETLSTVVNLELFDPLTNAPLNNFCGPLNIFQKNLSSKQTSIVSWSLVIPITDKSFIGYRLKAANAIHTDIEEKIIPILSNRTTVSEALPITMETSGESEFTLEKLKNNSSTTLHSKALHFSFSGNPIWSVVKALPYAAQPQVASADQLFSSLFISKLGGKISASHPEIEQEINAWTLENKELFNSELFKKSDLKTTPLEESPWTNNATSESEQRQHLKQFFDENLRIYNEQKLDQQLQDLQLQEGGFTWFPGGKATPQLTNDIVFLNTVLLETNGTKVSDKTLQYLEDYYEKDVKPTTIKNYMVSTNDLQWLIIKKIYQLPASTSSEYLEKCMVQQWSKLPLMEQALSCYFAHLMNDKEKVKTIQKALLNTATTRKNLGTYWNQQTISTTEKIETHALLLFVLDAIGTDSTTLNSIQLNLLQQKRTQLWENNRTTALVSSVLLQTANKHSFSNNNAQISIGTTVLSNVNSGAKELTKSWYGTSITPELAKIKITQNHSTPSFGSLVWTYSEETDKISASKKEGLTLKKEIYMIKNGKEIAVTKNTSLNVGDQLRIKLTVECDRTMEFIHLKDAKMSGSENLQQLPGYRFSSTHGNDKFNLSYYGISYYEIPQNTSTDFFIEQLPKGTHVISYDQYLTNIGGFSIGTADVESMYAPEFRSSTKSERLKVR